MYKPARLLIPEAYSGCSLPRAFSMIVLDSIKSGSAFLKFPVFCFLVVMQLSVYWKVVGENPGLYDLL